MRGMGGRKKTLKTGSERHISIRSVAPVFDAGAEGD